MPHQNDYSDDKPDDEWSEGYKKWREDKNKANKNYPEERKRWEKSQNCDCGGDKCKTTHSRYCVKFKSF